MKNKRVPPRIIKHAHGTPNPIIKSEEDALLTSVDKALSSSNNSQIIGANGEIPLRIFLNRYLPNVFRAVTGHFVSPSGKLSPQIDILILDSRYPLLSENNDGSVLAMVNSVVAAIEVKTRITTRDVSSMWENNISTLSLLKEEWPDDESAFCVPLTLGLAYRSRNRFDTLADNYFAIGNPQKGNLDLYLLRLPEKDQKFDEQIGGMLHFEPGDDELEYIPTFIPKYTPLADLYYNLIQRSYYCLSARDYDFSDIGRQLSNYMTWTTCHKALNSGSSCLESVMR